MVNMELENQKQYYLNLLQKLNALTNKLDDIINNLNGVEQKLINCYSLNDNIDDNDLIKNNKQNIIQVNTTLKNNVKLEILEILNEINRKINC